NKAALLLEAPMKRAEFPKQLRIENRPRLRIHEVPHDAELGVYSHLELLELGLWKKSDFGNRVYFGNCVHFSPPQMNQSRNPQCIVANNPDHAKHFFWGCLRQVTVFADPLYPVGRAEASEVHHRRSSKLEPWLPCSVLVSRPT